MGELPYQDAVRSSIWASDGHSAGALHSSQGTSRSALAGEATKMAAPARRLSERATELMKSSEGELAEGLFQVRDQIGGVLDAHRVANERRGDVDLLEVFL